ncbi:MAG: DUF2062 domain-containing protein [Gammaproteobacteria bacterium]|nr:DUF2062 domain-containing protein [Gammaproteobacteria bacterium]
MPKHIIKRFTPDHETIRTHKHLRMFGALLHDSNLWHMNRRSVSGAFAVGLFWAFVPIPFQMVAAAFTAIICRVNLPISVALVWISNPITIPPMFYATYLFGTWILGEPPESSEFEVSIEWMTNSLAEIWQPLYLGSIICGVIASLLGYILMRGFWRWHVVSSLRKRKERRNKNT